MTMMSLLCRHLCSRWSLSIFVSLLFLAVSLPALAQLGTGQIEGVVSDTSGAVVPDAHVTVTNTDTGVATVLTTDSGGRYRAINLLPGSYRVKIEKPGFKALERTGIEVTVGATTAVDLTLQIGVATQTVTVSEAAPLIEPEKTAVDSIVPKEVVDNVPVVNRRFDSYVFLTPGVSADGTFGLITYRGISGLYNNNMIDGADNNQAFFSEARGRTRVVYTYSEAAVKEFQVGLSNYNAEYGNAAGGLINAVTKSGTNQIHGEAFYYIRDSGTTAREPTINTATLLAAIGSDKLPERRQQFGFAVGGPVVRDKLFWFLNYDEQYRNFPYVVATSDPRYLTSGCAASAANCAATIQYLTSLETVVPRKAINNVALGRLDWQMSPKNNLTGYYNFQKWRSPNGIRTPIINFNAASDNGFDGVRTDNVYVTWNSVLSSHVINQVRFLYARDFEFETSNAPGPSTDPDSGFTFGQPNFLPRPAYPNEKRFQWVDNLSWLRNRHTFKFGADISYVRDSLINLFQGGGVYSYDTLSDLATDCPPGAIPLGCVPPVAGTPSHYGNYTQAFDLRVVAGTQPAAQSGGAFFTTTDYAAYAQDTFKIRPSVTLNYGVRYQFQHFPQPPVGNPAFPLTQTFNQDTNNFGPRVGLAWDIGKGHHTVVHAGYGVIYGRTSNSAIQEALLNNAITLVTFGFSPGPGAPTYPQCFLPGVNAPCTLPTPTGRFTPPDIHQFAADYAQPLVHQAELSIEHELFHDAVLSITYAFSGGRRLPIFRDVNMPQAAAREFFNVTGPLVVGGTALAPTGVFGPFPFYCNGSRVTNNCPATSVRPNSTVRRLIQSESVVNSSYNAMIVEFRKRMSHGVYVDGHFTWAKAMDDGQSSSTFFARNTITFDPFNLKLDRSLSDFDLHRRFVSSFVWQPDHTWTINSPAARGILGGWMLSGVVTIQDGKPVTPNGPFLSSRIAPIDTGSPNGSGGNRRVPFLARNAFTRPDFKQLDMRVSRSFHVTESKRIEFLAESLNALNRTNFTSVSNTAYSATSSTMTATSCGGTPINLGDRCITLRASSTFLTPNQASSTYTGPRDFQFAVRFFW